LKLLRQIPDIEATEHRTCVADKLNLTLELAIGNVSETVTVVGRSDRNRSTDRGLVFDPSELGAPTQWSPDIYAAADPGVIFTQEVFGPTGFLNARMGCYSSYKINGARTDKTFSC
jgi:hypothetical protein